MGGETLSWLGCFLGLPVEMEGEKEGEFDLTASKWLAKKKMHQKGGERGREKTEFVYYFW